MSHKDTDLKPYAEPVTASKLTPGEVYFMVTYVDNHMLLPEIQTLVFLGRDVAGDKDNCLYFQNVESYVTLGPYPNNAQGSGDLYSCTDNQLNNIFEFDNAIDEFLRCNIRRKKNPTDQYEFLKNQ
jgi:hypothetical protein